MNPMIMKMEIEKKTHVMMNLPTAKNYQLKKTPQIQHPKVMTALAMIPRKKSAIENKMLLIKSLPIGSTF